MTILIAPGRLAALFEASIVLLVDERLKNLVPDWVRRETSVLEFAGELIGDAEGAVELAATGLPAAPVVVVDTPDGTMGQQLAALAQRIGLSQPIETLRVESSQPNAEAEVERFLRDRLAGRSRLLAERLAAREAEIIALRAHLAAVNSKLLRVEDAMSLAGFVRDELTIAGQFPPPLPSGIPINAEGFTRLVLRRSSADVRTAIISFDAATRSTTTAIARFGEQGDVFEMQLPPDILAREESVTVSAQPLRETTAGIGPAAPGSIQLRLERDTGGRRLNPTGRPVLNLAASEKADLPVTRMLPLLHRRQTLATGIWLEPSDRISLAGRLHGTGPRSVRLEAIEHGTSAQGAPGFAVDGTIEGNAVTFAGTASRRGRFDLVVTVAGGATSLGTVVWGPPLVTGATTPTAFGSARFSALANILSYCDGNEAELEENRRQGHAVISVSDGAGYLQTHPVVDKVTGARLPEILPAGTSRLWLDIENAHRSAGATEFLALALPQPLDMPVAEWLRTRDLGDYEGVSIVEEEGTLIARRKLDGGTRTTLDLMWPAPIPFTGSLYCLVRPLTRNTAYGWCRWHRLLVGVPASHQLDLPAT